MGCFDLLQDDLFQYKAESAPCNWPELSPKDPRRHEYLDCSSAVEPGETYAEAAFEGSRNPYPLGFVKESLATLKTRLGGGPLTAAALRKWKNELLQARAPRPPLFRLPCCLTC